MTADVADDEQNINKSKPQGRKELSENKTDYLLTVMLIMLMPMLMQCCQSLRRLKRTLLRARITVVPFAIHKNAGICIIKKTLTYKPLLFIFPMELV